ncbi:MAG: DUF6461 domain-containing protein [Micromonosporaceae bacterium]
MPRYAWVEPLEAYCFTAVIGLDADEVIARLGADPGGCRRLTFDECFWTVDAPQWAQVGVLDGGVLVAEHNGWRGEEAAGALSTGARAACFCRDVSAAMQFSHAVDGVLLATFDPLLEPAPVHGADPGCLDRLLADLPFGLDAAEISAMALLERVTGVRISAEWLRTPQRAIRLPPLV